MSDLVESMNAEQHADVVEAVTAAMRACECAVKKLDADATASLYMDSLDFRFYDGGQPATYADMVAGVRAMFDGLQGFTGR